MAFKEFNTDIGVQGKISLTTVPNKAGTLLTYGSEGDISTRTNAQIISDLGLISAVNIASNYYTQTQLQTSGQSQVHWGNITSKPNTLEGYGITDAHKVDRTGGLINVSDSHRNQSWFDYNWANTGRKGSVISFGGLNDLYNTEFFGMYNNDGNEFAVRTRNGDTNVWNPRRWLWHSGNFNPVNYVPYTGASQSVNLGGNNLIANIGSFRGIVIDNEDEHGAINFKRNNSLRWYFTTDPSPEDGNNNGSELSIYRYNNNGDYLGRAMWISRSTGDVTFENRVTAQHSLVGGAIALGEVSGVLRWTKQSSGTLGALAEDNGWANIQGGVIYTANHGDSSQWNTAYNNNHTHSNKIELDTINQSLGTSYKPTFGGMYIQGGNIEGKFPTGQDSYKISNRNGDRSDIYLYNPTKTSFSKLAIENTSVNFSLTHNSGEFWTISYNNSIGYPFVQMPMPTTKFRIGRFADYLPQYTFLVTGNSLYEGEITANKIIKSGGTSSEFLKADGSVDTKTYLTSSDLIVGGRNYIKTSQVIQMSSNIAGAGTTVMMNDGDGKYTRTTAVGAVSTYGQDGSSTDYAFVKPMVVGQTYTVSVDVRVPVAGPVGFFANIFINNVTEINKWVRISGTYVYSGNRVLGLSYQESNIIDSRNWKIEKGNVATDWTPAPEDLVSDWGSTDADSLSFIKNKPDLLSEIPVYAGNQRGLVPDRDWTPKGQVITDTKYLCEDGSWKIPPNDLLYYTAGAGLELFGNTFSLKEATATGLGGIKLGHPSTQTITMINPTSVAGRTYPVQRNSNGGIVVNIPWSDTTYTLASLGGEPAFSILPVTKGGTGVSGLTNGYIKASGGAPFSTVPKIPYQDVEGMPYASNRDFALGTLITTSIDYSNENGEPFLLEIKGNTYDSGIPLDVKVQGYIYYNSLINYYGITNSNTLTGITALNVGGKLCFWFPRLGYWQGYVVNCIVAYGGYQSNKVTSITDSADPGGTKRVQIPFDRILNTSNFGTTVGTVAQGNDSRINNGQTAYNWGNHAGLYSLLNHSHTFNSITNKPTTLPGYGITDAVTLNTIQSITAQKSFSGGQANSFDGSPIILKGNGSTIYPSIGFWQPDIYAGVLSFREDSSFHFKTFNDTNYVSVKANSFIKNGGTSEQMLLADGSIYPVSNLVTTDTLTQSITGLKTFQSALTSSSFVKIGGSSTQILMANGSTKEESSIVGTVQTLSAVINEASTTVSLTGGGSISVPNTYIGSPDGTRTPNDNKPNGLPRRVRFDFANAFQITGATGNYGGVMTYSPWDGLTASTGDSSYQLAFHNETGVNGSGLPGLSLRKGIDDSWGSWYKMWHTGNFNPADFVNLTDNQTIAGKKVFTDMTTIHKRLGLKNTAGVEKIIMNSDLSRMVVRQQGASNNEITFFSWDESGPTNFPTIGLSPSNSTVAIGCYADTYPGYNLQVGGSARMGGSILIGGTYTGTAFYESSLRNLKENIQPFEKSGVELIKELDIVTYDRIDGTKDKIGIIADDTRKEFLSEEMSEVDLYKTIFIQARAIQELTARIEALENGR